MKITMKGTTPLLQHNERLVDPLDEHTKRLAALTSKRKKTEADHKAISDCEWLGALYWSEEIGPFMRGEAVKKAISQGATKNKLGAPVMRGLVMALDSFECPIEYSGPRDIASLMEDENHRLKRSVGVGKKRVIRTRPRFKEWQIVALAEYDDREFSPEQLQSCAEDGGALYGFGDGRGIGYGRYTATVEEV